jgi:hypothetical protein
MLVVVDSWSAQTKQSSYENCGKDIEIMVLPKKSTCKMQPCDLMVFGPWKQFVKKFNEHIAIHDLTEEINLEERNTHIILNSLILNQFQSLLFRDMFKYAWAKGGFQVPKCPYLNLNDICFRFTEPTCHNCDEVAFIKCSICRKVLCIKCFFINYDYHPLSEIESNLV